MAIGCKATMLDLSRDRAAAKTGDSPDHSSTSRTALQVQAESSFKVRPTKNPPLQFGFGPWPTPALHSNFKRHQQRDSQKGRRNAKNMYSKHWALYPVCTG